MRETKKKAAKKSGKKATARKTAGKTARKAPRKAAARTAKKAVKKTAKKTAKKATKKTTKKARKITARPAARPAARAPRAARPAAPPRPTGAGPLGILEMHMSYATRQADAIAAFFRDRLGFSTGQEPLQPGQFVQYTSMPYMEVKTNPGASLGFMAEQGEPDETAGSVGTAEAPTLYFMCVDVEKVYGLLSDRGADIEGPPQDMPWGHRVFHLRDPEGRSIAFAQQMMH